MRLLVAVAVPTIGVLLAISCGSVEEPRFIASTDGSDDLRPTPGLTVDLVRCDPADYSFAFGLGHVEVKTLGRDGDFCVLEHTLEAEMGYRVSHCRVPALLMALTISETRTPDVGDYGYWVGVKDSVDLSQHCVPLYCGVLFRRYDCQTREPIPYDLPNGGGPP